jgi:cytochrome bd-type quinol oxidase subunit 2
VVGVVLAAVVVACVLLQSRKKGAQDSGAQKRKHSSLWLAVVLALGVAGVVVFLLTEDMSRVMGLVDKWTIANAVIFVAELIAILFALKHRKAAVGQKSVNPKAQQ